jgi:hypothetical protein
MVPRMRQSVRLVSPVIFSAVIVLLSLTGLDRPGQAVDAATPTPAPAAGTTTAAGPVATVSSAVANIRGGPGTTYPMLGQAKKGERLPITGRNSASSWWQVSFKGKPGWVAASLVQAGPGAAQVKLVAAPASPRAPAAKPTAALMAVGPPLPPFQKAVTLGEGTAYPVRAGSVTGWGYEFVDKSEDYDLLVNRDIFGVFLNQLWPDLLKQHPKGMRITFTDAIPGVNYQGSQRGFGDGESGWVADVGCSTTHEEHNTVWPNELVECNVTLVSPGPGLTDLAIAAAVLGYGRAENGSFSPVFDREPYTLLGKPVRDVDSGQWRWSDPFLQVVSLKPVVAAAAAAPPAPKGPLPPPAGRIAFTRGRDYNAPIPAGYNDIAVVDVKTGEVRVVAQFGRQPDMRSDGRIVFNGEGGGQEDLLTVEPDGSNLTQIGAHPEDSYPSWSDGAAVAFHSQLAGPQDRIFVQWNTQGREEPQFLEVDSGSNMRPFTGRFPVWVGGRIAYSGCDEWAKRSNCGLRIVDVAALMRTRGSSSVQLLTPNPEDRPTDAYGETILFASPKAGDWDLYTIPASGGKARNLTQSPGQELGGTFSPDGNYIAFMSDRGGGWGIWIMEADGANPRQLIAVPEGFGKLFDQDRVSWGP